MTAAPTLTVTDVEGGKKVTAVNHEASIGGKLKYTNDGTIPTSTSTNWPSAGVTITEVGTTTIKVAAFIGTTSSSVATVDVVIEEPENAEE